MTLEEWKIFITNNPELTARQCDRIREAFHKGVFDVVKLTKIIEICELIDFNKSNIVLYRILTNACLNFLLDDDEVSEAAGELDWISKTKGNNFTTKLNQSTLPLAVKKHILLKIEEKAANILSTKMLNAIEIAKQ